MFPRTGTVTGFRPIVESTMISFHRVLGDGGARQYRFIHGREGYGEAILSSHQLDSGDAMLIFSHSGLNSVTLDIAQGARDRGMKLIGVTSIPHSSSTPSRHSCGKRLFELADVVIDTGVPSAGGGCGDCDRRAEKPRWRDLDIHCHRNRAGDQRGHRRNSGRARVSAQRDGEPEHR